MLCTGVACDEIETKRGRGQLGRLRRCGGHDDAVAGDDCKQEVFEEGRTSTSAHLLQTGTLLGSY